MKSWLSLGLLTVLVASGCTDEGKLPTAPPATGTPAGPPREPTTEATKRHASGVLDQSDLID
jgi:hypothetical protein